ncbi:unnamed protein product [Ostreobium quekettii]|uniref:Mitochondrial proton/calcium exchanger protein n=1 Tax=Ostreobium quekettii TaxID=121088 RepID=A0A8S1JAS6_9CHLO|nr:unnamed protein product [Ostreobium quekettii]|eukprot:evm.model.scf_341EXC.3 EVM.evm.TU.scf_341EXC.3   scf_341EXC:50248-58857(+)
MLRRSLGGTLKRAGGCGHGQDACWEALAAALNHGLPCPSPHSSPAQEAWTGSGAENKPAPADTDPPWGQEHLGLRTLDLRGVRLRAGQGGGAEWQAGAIIDAQRALSFLRKLSAEPLRAEEDPEPGCAAKVDDGGPLGDPGDRGAQGEGADPGAGKPSPEECDRAIDDYDRLLDKSYRSSFPASAAPISAAASAAAGATRRAVVWCFRLIAGMPLAFWAALTSPAATKARWMRSTWKSVKEGARHYWVGTKLFVTEVGIANRLIFKILMGKELTRRENTHLMRTVADIFRLVPMIIMLVVPFLEFLLPVALRLFPNMLPSTFEDKLKKEEEMKKRLAAKLQVAHFLQDTVALMARDLRQKRTGDVQASAAELYQFMKRVRRGEPVDNNDIIRFGQLFNDEITLDNLDRVQLVSMCQFVGLSPFGTDSFLQTRLRAHLGYIKRDDLVIRSEGVDALTEDELRQASRARGMRAPYGEGAREFMKAQMEDWLELSLDRALPSSLLLLSRTFTVTLPIVGMEKKKAVELESFKNTLSTLPDFVTEDVAMEVLRDESEDNTKKLQYIKRKEQLIRDEAEAQAQQELNITGQPAEASEASPGSVGRSMAATTTAAAVVQAAEAQLLSDAFKSASEESEEERAHKLAEAREQKMKKVLNALAVLSSKSGVSSERSKFMELVKREVNRIQDDMSQRGGASLRFTSRGLEAWRPAELPELPGDYISKKLEGKVSSILHRIEKELDYVDHQIGEKLHLLDTDDDGLISREELEAALGFLGEQLGQAELRHLLEEMCGPMKDDFSIDVEQLMQIADKMREENKTPSDKSTKSAAEMGIPG